jgi:hypothetical protein
MMEGRAKLNSHDNDRYHDLDWTSVKELMGSQNIKKYV